MPYTKDRSITVATPTYHAHDASGYNPTGFFLLNNNIKLTRSRTGENNLYWRQQVRDQQNATTPMQGTYDTYESLYGEAVTTVKNRNVPADKTLYFHRVRGDIARRLSTQLIDWSPTVSMSDAKNDALIKFLKKVRQVQTSFSAPTFIGELGEALHMIRHPAQGLRNIAGSWLDKVKRIKNQRPKNWKKNLSGAWLEQAFGWQPLISDINSAYETYRGLVDSNKQVPVTGFGIREKYVSNRSSQYNSANVGPNSTFYRYNQRGTEKAFARYRGMVVRDVEATIHSKLQRFGFNAEEFFPTAWELLPWSFLIDYFSNIGDVIQSEVACKGTVAWVNVSTVTSQTIEIGGSHSKTDTAGAFPTYVSSWGDGVASKLVRRAVTRSVNVSLGDPYLAFRLPGSPYQWANMLALFTQCSKSLYPQRRPTVPWLNWGNFHS